MKKQILTSAIISTLLFAASAVAGEATPKLPTPDQQVAQPIRNAGLDAAALQRAQAKFSRAMQIANRFAPQSAQGVTDINWKHQFITNLMASSEAAFPSVEAAGDASDAMGRSYAAGAQTSTAAGTAKDLGSATIDLTYIPFTTPCRIVDTRVTGGVIVAATPRTFGYSNTNGSGASCNVTPQIPGGGIPAAEAVNVTVDETSLTGFPAGAYVAIYPQGGTLGTSFLNFGPSDIIANAGIISLNQANGQFTVKVSQPANLIVDAFGVFIPPQATALECTLTTSAASIPPTTAGTFVFAPACPTGTHAVSVYCWDQDQAGLYMTGSGVYGGTTGSSAFCGFKNLTSGALNITVGPTCCNIPGR
ncbi:MAG: hypothetical protein ABI846_06940 [Rudaea sp.]